jgi:hypothetical protein
LLEVYDENVRPLWDQTTKKADQSSSALPKGLQLHFWIEKTIVQGRPSRQEGEYALGKAPWSPQRSDNGADIYRFMREVQAGDVVLHLTDNTAFTGISRAAGPAEEFGGLQFVALVR